jgi:ribosomal protein L40E
MAFCILCEAALPTGARACPACGTPAPRTKSTLVSESVSAEKGRPKQATIAAGALFVFAVLWLVGYYMTGQWFDLGEPFFFLADLSYWNLLVPVVAIFAGVAILVMPAFARQAGSSRTDQGNHMVLYTEHGEKVLVPSPSATNGWAVASLVLALTCGASLAGLPAIIAGHVARGQIRARGGAGGGLAMAGLVIGYLTLLIYVILLIAFVAA